MSAVLSGWSLDVPWLACSLLCWSLSCRHCFALLPLLPVSFRHPILMCSSCCTAAVNSLGRKSSLSSSPSASSSSSSSSLSSSSSSSSSSQHHLLAAVCGSTSCRLPAQRRNSLVRVLMRECPLARTAGLMRECPLVRKAGTQTLGPHERLRMPPQRRRRHLERAA